MITDTAKSNARVLNLVAYERMIKGDALLERTVADLIAKGTDPLRAHIIAVNTFND